MRTTIVSGQRIQEGFYLLLVLVFAGIVIAPLLQPGYFWGAHDARHDVYFIQQYDKSVQDGIWFARWGPDWAFGYGYPFWIVYGPLATFLGELFHHFGGLDFEASVKAVLGLSVVLSGLAMYGFVGSWLGRKAGLVAAVAYMTIPYHLVDVFVRAAMAESLALAFMPLALWGFREAVTRPRLTAVIGAGIAYALIMWTSNLVALVSTPALAAYVVFLAYALKIAARRPGLEAVRKPPLG
ncbi:MAG: glycosyltransferase family 39 protein, partial [Anaerolineae bacterium]|nr:glycosyltransferase family 39 protein [Anaerolineae bacterium]